MKSIISLKRAHIQNCYLCKQVSHSLICDTCYSTLPLIEKSLSSSSLSIINQGNLLLHPSVKQALGKTTFNRLICPMLYRWPFDYLIKQFKFSRADYLAQTLCNDLLQQIKTHVTSANKPDAIVPIPIHIKRFAMRRFNQSAILAQHLSAALNIPVNYQLCRRKHFSFAQSKLSGSARRKNLKNAFSAETTSEIQHIAIVDDVITTGATVEALSSAIKRKNPHINIDVWTLAISSKNVGLD